MKFLSPTFARGVEIALGLLFLASASLKALDMEAFAVQVSFYGVTKEPWLLTLVAHVTTIIETFLSAAMLIPKQSARGTMGGIRVAAMIATLLLLIVFSGLIGWAWAFHDLKDCGCFGKYMPMTPGVSIIKNVVMMLMAGYVLATQFSYRRKDEEVMAPQKLLSLSRGMIMFVCVASVGGAYLGGNNTNKPSRYAPPDEARPYASFAFKEDGEKYNLGEGAYLVAMLSATCDHCKAEVPHLNELLAQSGAPMIVGLVLGEVDEIEAFRSATTPLFSLHRIEALQFRSLVPDKPPYFVLSMNGAVVASWQDKTPAIEAVLDAMKRGAASRTP